MPGIACAVLGADDDDVASVAIGDDLILQVARGVAAAHVRFERAPQARPLFPQAIANLPELGARASTTSPAPSMALANRGRLAFERGESASASAASVGHSAAGKRRITSRTRSIDSTASARPSRRSGSSGRSATASAVSVSSKSSGARSGNDGCSPSRRTPSLVAASAASTRRRIGHGLERGESPGAHGREREAGQRLDDTIELERSEGTGVHEELGPGNRSRPDRARPGWSTLRRSEPEIIARKQGWQRLERLGRLGRLGGWAAGRLGGWAALLDQC